MPIMFDEVTADIAPPAAPAEAPQGSAAASVEATDMGQPLRETLAILLEREARLWVD